MSEPIKITIPLVDPETGTVVEVDVEYVPGGSQVSIVSTARLPDDMPSFDVTLDLYDDKLKLVYYDDTSESDDATGVVTLSEGVAAFARK